MHDVRMFGCTGVADMVEEGFQQPTHQYGEEAVAPFLVGDSAYALAAALMKPYSDTSRDPRERHFNKELSRARVKIENSFGIMKSRFRILSHRIEEDLGVVADLIFACTVLHNICITHGDLWPDESTPDTMPDPHRPNHQPCGESLRDFLKDQIFDD